MPHPATPPAPVEGSEYRLSEVIAALSRALDLTEGQPVGHAQRSCVIGLEVARRLGIEADARVPLLYALLLKDAGCSSAAARMTELFAADDLALKRDFKRVDWTNRGEVLGFMVHATAPDASPFARAGQLLRAIRGFAAEGHEIVETRCDRGARVVAMLGCPPEAAAAVRALDEHWDGSGKPEGMTGDEIPMLARIAGLAQTAEIFHSADGWAAAAEVVRARRGRWFDPRVADAYLSIADDDPLWPRMREGAVVEAVLADDSDGTPAMADESRLDRIAEAFGDVIDAKSPYTARHSTRVARFAVAIGGRLGLDPAALRTLRRAGLLHDVGKLGLSNAILDKPERLTAAEFAQVRMHPHYSQRILSGTAAFADIVEPAASHHERLDGRGYHRGLGGEALSRLTRCLTVADVFEALIADRPYRGPMDIPDAMRILWEGAGTAFDPVCVSALEASLDQLAGPELEAPAAYAAVGSTSRQ